MYKNLGTHLQYIPEVSPSTDQDTKKVFKKEDKKRTPYRELLSHAVILSCRVLYPIAQTAKPFSAVPESLAYLRARTL
jgi:hypothetical protein